MNRIHIWVGVGTLAIVLAAMLTRKVAEYSRLAAARAKPGVEEIVWEQSSSNRVAADPSTDGAAVYRRSSVELTGAPEASATNEPPLSTDSTGPRLAGLANDRQVLPGREPAGPLPLATVLLDSTTRRFIARPGCSLKISGDSAIHQWSVESRIVGGYLEIPGQAMTAPDVGKDDGLVDAEAVLSVPVRALKSGKDALDRGLQEALRADEHPMLKFTLNELRRLGSSEDEAAAAWFQAKGVLMAAGVEIEKEAEVEIQAFGDHELQVTTQFNLKMSEFGIDPTKLPAPTNVPIDVDDQVAIELLWLVATRP